jgi:asparagine N-glycosylation enzyme membrane subunit Stt3
MRSTGLVQHLAARAILVLLILVPFTVLLTARKTSLAWLVWTVVSLWALMDAVRLTTLAFPERHSPTRAIAVAILAAVNMALSLGLALSPSAWISAVH